MTDLPRRPDRLLPEIPFPPYSFVPGQSPHPVRDPNGHSYGKPEPSVDVSQPWQEWTPYLFGIDLFNHGYFWEAHEEWEAVWHALGRRGPKADYFKALVHLAAAGVKHKEGRPKGVESHLQKGLALALGVRQTVDLGVSMTQLCQQVGRQIDRLKEGGEWTLMLEVRQTKNSNRRGRRETQS